MTRAAVIERHRQQREARANDPLRIADEWFPEQRSFYDSKARLLAVIKGRRAGGTRGLAGHYIRQAVTVKGSQLLYINSTLDECRRLFWIGMQSDGVYSLVQKYNINAEPDRTRLTLHFPDSDSWIYCRGAKDETELSKALGSAYTEVTWDEAQKIRPTMSMTIREVLMPTLLDFGGRLRYVGTANRQQSGVFWDITQPDTKKRTGGWEVHHWNMLANPHFGRAVMRDDGTWWVYALKLDAPVSGPHTKTAIAAAVSAARMKYGIEQLAHDLDVPVDSPIIQREGFGVWTPEDSAYVYAIRKSANPYYAPAHVREDGFPDVQACLLDLPGDWTEYTFSMGGDLGFRDAFALHCWAWHHADPNLYEVFSWKRAGLDSDQQFNAIKEVREILPLGQIVVDAGGIGLQVSVAWSKIFVERYNLPIEPAQKDQKASFQDVYNTDIANGRCRFREGGETAEEMMMLQWSKLVSGTGKQIEDPTQDNHALDASLYAHRASYAYRSRPEDKPPAVGTAAHFARIAAELEDENDEQFEQPWRRRGRA